MAPRCDSRPSLGGLPGSAHFKKNVSTDCHDETANAA
jgi:hypothetical protein